MRWPTPSCAIHVSPDKAERAREALTKKPRLQCTAALTLLSEAAGAPLDGRVTVLSKGREDHGDSSTFNMACGFGALLGRRKLRSVS
jgi:hypothetical protein